MAPTDPPPTPDEAPPDSWAGELTDEAPAISVMPDDPMPPGTPAPTLPAPPRAVLTPCEVGGTWSHWAKPDAPGPAYYSLYIDRFAEYMMLVRSPGPAPPGLHVAPAAFGNLADPVPVAPLSGRVWVATHHLGPGEWIVAVHPADPAAPIGDVSLLAFPAGP